MFAPPSNKYYIFENPSLKSFLDLQPVSSVTPNLLWQRVCSSRVHIACCAAKQLLVLMKDCKDKTFSKKCPYQGSLAPLPFLTHQGDSGACQCKLPFHSGQEAGSAQVDHRVPLRSNHIRSCRLLPLVGLVPVQVSREVLSLSYIGLPPRLSLVQHGCGLMCRSGSLQVRRGTSLRFIGPYHALLIRCIVFHCSQTTQNTSVDSVPWDNVLVLRRLHGQCS